jgi:hypothetical protein
MWVVSVDSWPSQRAMTLRSTPRRSSAMAAACRVAALIIAFPRLPGRPLQTPLYGPQDLPHMAGMIVNARGPLDDRRHPGQCPQIASETVDLCALTQRLVHLLELRPVQFRPAACPPCPTYPIRLILLPCLEPSAHAWTADVEFTGDLGLVTACRRQTAARRGGGALA